MGLLKLDRDEILKDSSALRAIEEQGHCNNMKGDDIINDLKNYLYSSIEKIELKNNDHWWDTLLLHPKKATSPINTILCIMLAYKWKADEIHISDPENHYYKITTPIQNLPEGWFIRVWWD